MTVCLCLSLLKDVRLPQRKWKGIPKVDDDEDQPPRQVLTCNVLCWVDLQCVDMIAFGSLLIGQASS